jgi:two-component system chemotaxis response regulator CheB
MAQQLRVLIVDDSAFMRKILTDLLQSDPTVVVVGTARDGEDAIEKCLTLLPDVITLDIEMPRLDGYGALREIMARRPTPVVMVSSLTQEGTEATVRALALGAVDFVAKPSGAISLNMHVTRNELLVKVKTASSATPRYRRVLEDLPGMHRVQTWPLHSQGALKWPRRLVVIGCSTGGPGALHQVIPRLPADLAAAVLVVQHMPAGFTRSLAQRLDEISAIPVREAADGERVLEGQVLIAPGGQHLLVNAQGCVQLSLDPQLHGVRPAVDKTFESVVPLWGAAVIGVVLTGMGYDGAKGMVSVKRIGGRTLAEDASTCVVYGMPKVVAEMGAADQVLPVQSIADAIVRLVREG